MIDFVVFAEKFRAIFKANKLEQFTDEKVIHSFYLLTQRMMEVNEQMNLTAIRDIDGIIVKHYADSLTASPYIPTGAKLIDIGCGAGFPSLPLAIARPDLRILAVDSTAKRIHYISETAEILGLPTISALAARAEELAQKPIFRESFDISCARAVARLNVLCELCLPLVKKGGSFLAMKANAGDELTEASQAITLLGGKLISSNQFDLLSESNEPNPRTIISIEKISLTPKIYPRNNAQMTKKPL